MTSQNKKCIFCQLAHGSLTASYVYKNEEDSVVAFLDKFPLVKAHVLVTSTDHFEHFSSAPDEITSKVIILAKAVARAIKKSGIECQGFSYLMTEAAAGGQMPNSHCHLHVIPRTSQDGIRLFGSFKKEYRKPESSRAELDETAEIIKSHLVIPEL